MSTNSTFVAPGPYSNRGYSVTIGPDGSIQVTAGDTIGAYSMAIWGDFEHLHDYSRRVDGVLRPVANINVIYTGETLWHELSLPKVPPVDAPQTPEPALPKKPNGEYDVHRILEKYKLPPNYYLPVSNLVNDGVKGTRAFFTLLTMFEVSIPVASPIMAFAGPVLGVVGSIYALWKARNYGLMQVGFRASTYGAVAWAHDQKDRPKLPSAIKRSLIASGRNDDIDNYEDVWREGVNMAYARLDSIVAEGNYAADDVRMAMRAFAKAGTLEKGDEYNQKILAVRLLLDAADNYAPRNFDRRSFLSPWSWYPNDKYVGRPSYPSELSKAYGW